MDPNKAAHSGDTGVIQAGEILLGTLKAATVDAATMERSRAPLAPWLPFGLLLLPLLVFISAWPLFMGTDSDYWWHVRTGQLTWETGAVPREEPFSYTSAGRAWVTHEWLTEVLFYVGQRSVGYVGNALGMGAVAAAGFGLMYSACRRRGVGELASALLMVWGFVMAAGALNVRPQTVTVLFTATLVWLLLRYREGERRALWPLPVLFAVWVNLHGGYVFGFLLLGLTVVGEGVGRALHRSAAPVMPLVAAGGASLLATLINPHGVEALLYPFSYAGVGNASLRYIAEWQSPDFHNPIALIFASGLLVAVALGLGARPLGATDLLWGVVVSLMALQSSRHIPLFAIVVLPLLGARLQEVVPAFRRRLADWRRPAHLAVLWPAVAACLALLVAKNLLDGSGLQLGREPSTRGYPVDGVTYISEQGLSGRLFNEYHWGGYVLYSLYPRQRVFIDGRADVYGDAFMDVNAGVQGLNRDWQRTLQSYDISVALVARDSLLANALADSGEWEERLVGPVERVFTRR